jgi:hypothetical protein
MKDLVQIRVTGWPITYNGMQFPGGSITAIPARQAERLVARGAAAYVEPGETAGDEPAPNEASDATAKASRSTRKKEPSSDEDV